VFGKANFDPNTRRIAGVKSIDLVVRNGQWAELGNSTVAAK
jgi:branched-chain amino acid transport system substrate-binding protein